MFYLPKAVECSLIRNLPTTFSSDRKTWLDQGIGCWRDVFHFDLSSEVREWLNEHVGMAPHDWWWDHFEDEAETAIMFRDPNMAMLFKLTWL